MRLGSAELEFLMMSVPAVLGLPLLAAVFLVVLGTAGRESEA